MQLNTSYIIIQIEIAFNWEAWILARGHAIFLQNKDTDTLLRWEHVDMKFISTDLMSSDENIKYYFYWGW